MPATIDSNKTSLTYAEEVTLKVLPAMPVWFPLEPNTYANFGGDLKTTPREPINATRQRAKGTVTDLDVSAGFNTDFTQTNLTRMLQGFFFAKAHEKPNTQPINGTKVAITAVVATVGPTIQHFLAATGLAAFPVGSILKSSGFSAPQNNTLIRTTISSAGSLTGVGHVASAAGTLVAEAAPSASAKLQQVGFALTGDVKLYGPGSTFGGGTVVQAFLQSTATVDFTTLGLTPGEWVYLGDSDDTLSDTSATEFNFVGAGGVRNRGFCRIGSISARQLVFDISIGSDAWALSGSGDGSNAIGASAYVSLYFGTMIRNEPDPLNIIRTTYTLQRYLGKGVGNLDNLEYVSGAIPNEFTFNIPSNNKLAVDLSFIGMDTKQQHAAALTGTYLPLHSEEAFNTSEDVFAMLLYKINPAVTTQAPLFGYATDEKIVINNNAKTNKAIGVVGGFEGSVGNFDVSGSLTCYFDDIAAQQAVRDNADVGLINIFAKKNAGFILDLPLLTLALSGLKVEKDQPIMADINQTASPGALNYTAQYNTFDYLPSSAMADYVG